MKAIVLSYDRNLPFVDHMISTYQKFWPNNLFVFRVPYQNYPDFLQKKYGEKVELIKTGSPIKATILKLLEDLNDEDWVYWCMDDRYLIKCNVEKAQALYEYVLNIQDKRVCIVQILRTFRDKSADKFVKKKQEVVSNEKVNIVESIFSDTDKLVDIWSHQFLRVKVLKRIFQSFPDQKFVAKDMDSFEKTKLIGEKIWMSKDNLFILGESTHRGELTENCISSLTKFNLEVPQNIRVSKKYLVHGKLPYNFLNIEFEVPNQIQSKIVQLIRLYDRKRSNFDFFYQQSNRSNN